MDAEGKGHEEFANQPLPKIRAEQIEVTPDLNHRENLTLGGVE